MRVHGDSANREWQRMLGWVLDHGEPIESRGMRASEVQSYSAVVDMRFPVVDVAERKMGHRFRCAEAFWILSGDDRVETIKDYADIAKYSDNGTTFFGAYGPKIVNQLSYVCGILEKDIWSRQAVINIWRENPPRSKDIPCTLSLQFMIRPHVHTWFVDCVATMRSSDAWMGWVYDVFNFSMVSFWIMLDLSFSLDCTLGLGNLYLNTGSQHIYEEHRKQAMKCRVSKDYGVYPAIDSVNIITPGDLMDALRSGRDVPWPPKSI